MIRIIGVFFTAWAVVSGGILGALVTLWFAGKVAQNVGAKREKG